MPYIHGPRRTYHRMRTKPKEYDLPKMEQPIVTPIAISVPNLSAETVPQHKQDGREQGNMVLAKEVPETSNVDVNGQSSKHSEETDSLQNFHPRPGRKKPKRPFPIKSHYMSDIITSLENTSLRDETEFDVWAKSLAMQLNKMNLARSLRLQLHIQQLLTEDRIEHECSQ